MKSKLRKILENPPTRKLSKAEVAASEVVDIRSRSLYYATHAIDYDKLEEMVLEVVKPVVLYDCQQTFTEDDFADREVKDEG